MIENKSAFVSGTFIPINVTSQEFKSIWGSDQLNLKWQGQHALQILIPHLKQILPPEIYVKQCSQQNVLNPHKQINGK